MPYAGVGSCHKTDPPPKKSHLSPLSFCSLFVFGVRSKSCCVASERGIRWFHISAAVSTLCSRFTAAPSLTAVERKGFTLASKTQSTRAVSLILPALPGAPGAVRSRRLFVLFHSFIHYELAQQHKRKCRGKPYRMLIHHCAVINAVNLGPYISCSLQASVC